CRPPSHNHLSTPLYFLERNIHSRLPVEPLHIYPCANFGLNRPAEGESAAVHPSTLRPFLSERYVMRYTSILDTIGNTPCVRLQKIGPRHVNLFVKLEAFNPTSSVKDRAALGIIEHAEKTGALQPGQTV